MITQEEFNEIEFWVKLTLEDSYFNIKITPHKLMSYKQYKEGLANSIFKKYIKDELYKHFNPDIEFGLPNIGYNKGVDNFFKEIGDA